MPRRPTQTELLLTWVPLAFWLVGGTILGMKSWREAATSTWWLPVYAAGGILAYAAAFLLFFAAIMVFGYFISLGSRLVRRLLRHVRASR